MISRQPETIEEARGRFAASLEHIWDAEECMCGGPTPGQNRANVFDFSDGLRLIVSRDRTPDGRIVIHFSASLAPTSLLYRRVATGELERPDVHRLCLERFSAISGFGEAKPALIRCVGESAKGVPHWLVQEISEAKAVALIRGQAGG